MLGFEALLNRSRNHPFFRQNLPMYLNISATELIAMNMSIDAEALDLVSKLGYEKREILKAIEMGPDLLTCSEFPDRAVYRPMAVAYHLNLDNLRKFDQRKSWTRFI
jgi:hypothetical protein